jgi:hypothetical protein
VGIRASTLHVAVASAPSTLNASRVSAGNSEFGLPPAPATVLRSGRTASVSHGNEIAASALAKHRL